MRLSGRAALCVIVLVGATGAFKSCGGSPTSGGEDPPRTANDILQVTAAGATLLAVLSNDKNLVNEPLALTIDEAPFVGTASFNPDRTVRLDLPAAFRGVTRFKYKITNSLGGFSISTAVVFVDVPAYRVLFAAKSPTQAHELFVTDFISPVQISQATSGNLRLRNVWRSPSGAVISYERADPAQVASTTELFYVRTTPIAAPARIPQPAGRSFIGSTPVAISRDDRWIAFATAPATSTGQATNLYVLDANNAGSPIAVGLSANLLTSVTQWSGDQPALYFMSAPAGASGAAVYRASTGSFDAPQRVSPTYARGDTHSQVLVSPDQTRLVLVGTHAGQNGAYLVNPDSPNFERRLTSDMPAGAVIESFQINSDFSQLTYLWRLGVGANARLSVVPVAASGAPRIVLDADIESFTELRSDGAAALVTRGAGGPSSDGNLYEVSLDRSTADLRIASNVGGGVYDDTKDRVYVFSRTLAPAVIARSNFDGNVSPLVRNTTPPLALFVTPSSARSAAIIEDPTSGLVLVNAAVAGKTIKLSNLEVGSVSPTLLPAAIRASP
jgi:hypothetical protein